MTSDPVVNQILAINALSTIASIVCVLPTYFLCLRPETYRLVLSLAILFGLLPLIFFFQLSGVGFSLDAIFPIVVGFSPFVLVLIAILLRIRHVTRVGVWSTVVLTCVVNDCVGIFMLFLTL